MANIVEMLESVPTSLHKLYKYKSSTNVDARKCMRNAVVCSHPLQVFQICKESREAKSVGKFTSIEGTVIDEIGVFRSTGLTEFFEDDLDFGPFLLQQRNVLEVTTGQSRGYEMLPSIFEVSGSDHVVDWFFKISRVKKQSRFQLELYRWPIGPI